MQIPLTHVRRLTICWQRAAWFVLWLLSISLVVSVASFLWQAWRADSRLSHGPLIPLVSLALLWFRRSQLRCWDAADVHGLWALVFFALTFCGASWADIDFMKPLSLIGMGVGIVWFLGGRQTIAASLGAIAFLIFMIPWPTTLIERISFPMQLTGTAYAALFGGLCGLPIQRDGVYLHVTPDPESKPIYSIFVAQQCSGLTSLMVLLALGYLIAYYTETGLGRRLLLVAAVVPLALLANALRLTLILLAGAHSSPALAKWVHDNEGPVLIFMCSLGLMALRTGLLAWRHPSISTDTVDGEREEGIVDEALPASDRQ